MGDQPEIRVVAVGNHDHPFRPVGQAGDGHVFGFHIAQCRGGKNRVAKKVHVHHAPGNGPARGKIGGVGEQKIFSRLAGHGTDDSGLVVDALDEAYVILQWNQEKTSSSVNIYPNKSDKQ